MKKQTQNQTKKLKIAIVSDAIMPYNTGGKEKRIYEISTRLAKAGHEVHIYCMKWWKEDSNHKIENNIHLHAISKLYPLYTGERRSIKQALLFSLACFKLINADFDVIDVDHMPHFVLFPTKLVCLLKGKKLHATWNEVWGRKYWIEYMGQTGNIAYIIEWLSARMPDKIIAVSEHTKSKLIKDLKIKTKIVVIPNGINLQSIRKVKPSKQKSDMIFAGRLLSHKNVDVFIKSVKELKKDFPRIKAFIIGKGPEKENLLELTYKLQLNKNVTFFNFFKNYNDLYALMKSSKVLISPSTREGFGIVTLEANACGTPVITTNHKDNASKSLIKNGENGYIVTLNSRSIAEKVKNYMKNKGNNQYKNLIQYDWNTLARNIEEVYRQ